jgi:AraC-like DNA-binding protein
VYYAKGWYTLFPHAMGLTYPFPTLYGPLFYLYSRLISNKERHLRAVEFLHFAPTFLIYCITAPIFFFSGEEKIAFLNNMVRGIHHPIFTVFDFFVSIQGIVYTVLALKVVVEYDRRIKASYSSIDLINLNWLKYLNFGGAVIWSIVALGVAAKAVRLPLAQFNAMLNVPLSVLVYVIGYMGLKQPEIFLESPIQSRQDESAEKYQKSGLNDESAEEIKKRLLAVMVSEKPYLRQDLTLQRLAEQLKTSTHNLSEVINTRLHQSYYDFVNRYRVEEFKNRLAVPENRRYNLLSIALDSGFQSKGTFNSIFKKNTGMTPSEYKLKIDSVSQ